MKIIWEADDIKVGRRAKAPGDSEAFIIGYDPAFEDTKNLYLISLADGRIYHRGVTHLKMVHILNEHNLCPVELINIAGDNK